MTKIKPNSPQVFRALCQQVQDAEAFPWFYLGEFDVTALSAQAACIHYGPKIHVPSAEPLTPREMEQRHADGWRTTLPKIPPPPKSITLSRLAFQWGDERFGVFVGQCPDCGSVLWGVTRGSFAARALLDS